MRVGWRACTRSTSVVTPLASLGTAHRSPEGRNAISHWAFATSIPTKHGTSTRGTPVGPTLQIRAQWHQTTVRALGVQDVTTHAPLRSRRTKAQSVYHVRVLRDGDSPTSPLKDTRLLGVGSSALFGAGLCLWHHASPSIARSAKSFSHFRQPLNKMDLRSAMHRAASGR